MSFKAQTKGSVLIEAFIHRVYVYVRLSIFFHYTIQTTEAQTFRWHTRNPKQGSAPHQH
jgi:hypothetical protein